MDTSFQNLPTDQAIKKDEFGFCYICKEYLEIDENDQTVSIESKQIHDRDCPLGLKF